MKIRNKKIKAFTLIEILVVVAIIGVLTSIVVINLIGSEIKSRDTKRIADMGKLKTALGLYKVANGKYLLDASNPIDAKGCRTISTGTSINALVTAGFVDKLPKDPLSDDTKPCWSDHNYQWYYDPTDNSYSSNGISAGNFVLMYFLLEKPASEYGSIHPWYLSPANLSFGACAKPADVVAATGTTYPLDRANNEYCQIMD